MSQQPDYPPKRILIADDEPLYLRTTGDLLRRAGYLCECVPDARAAILAMQQCTFDLVLSDLNMPGNLQLELLHQGRTEWPDVPLIVITGVPSLPSAIESLRLGIVDYLIKPVQYQDLLSSVSRALTGRRPGQVIADTTDIWRQEAGPPSKSSGIIGESPPMEKLFGVLDRISRTDTNVLITGESGTGKEVVARTIHQQSDRSRHSFQVIDCTAVPESLFESVLFGHAKGAFTGAIRDQKGLLSASHNGTAFFDEIGELPLLLQSKLLRVVQEQTFTPVGQTAAETLNTRFVCATNRNLATEVSLGRFRRDLFYRLAVIHIELPPLRDRGEDVILLAHYFLRQLQPDGMRITGFSEEVKSCFRRYSWPGNVRELRNVVERTLAFTQSAQIVVNDLPPALNSENSEEALPSSCSEEESSQKTRKDAERLYLMSLLKSNRGNVTRAAIEAGLSRQGMHKMLARYGIQAAEYRE